MRASLDQLSPENRPGARKPDTYLYLVWLAVALSGFVYIEPAPYDILIISLFVIGFLFSMLRIPKRIIAPMILLWLFLIGNLVSLFFATNFYGGARYILLTVFLVSTWLFFIAFIESYGEKGLRTVISGYALAVIVVAFLGILAYYNILNWLPRFSGAERLGFGFKDANVFGPFLIFISLLSIAKVESGPFRGRIMWLAIFILSTTGVFLSFSRAAWLNYVVAYTVYIVLRLVRTTTITSMFQKLIYISIIALLAVIVVNYAVLTPRTATILLNRISLRPTEDTRFHTQKEALSEAFSKPLGIGPLQTVLEYNMGPHNQFVSVLIENGWMAFLAFVLFFLITIFRSFRLALRDWPLGWFFAVVTACLVGLLANSLLIDSLHWRHLWLLLAFPWAFGYNGEHGKYLGDPSS